jgi:hypothetical protein
MAKVDEIRLQFLKVHAYLHGRYVFIRIPKTGSASMNAALWNATEAAWTQRRVENVNVWLQTPGPTTSLGGWWDHYSAQFCKDALGEEVWGETVSFSIVRNPFARLYSFWKFQESKDEFKKWLMSGAPVTGQKLHHGIVYPENHMLNQKNWLSDASGNLIVDFICRLEELKNCEPIFKQIVDDRFKHYAERMNQTSEPNEYKEHYDEEMIDFVYKNCKDDIETFHYNFDGIEEPGWFYWSD